MSFGTSRRDLLKATGFAIGASLLGGCASSGSSRTVRAGKRAGSIRVAHLSDFHVQPELDAPRGMAKCLHHAQSHKPDLILNTGDCVMETLHTDRARTQVQWDIWNRVLKADCSTPIAHCIGNHDIWGWVKDRSGTTGTERGWGKQWAMDALGLARPYHAFDHGAWRFIMLDSVQPAAEGVWYAKLDDEQFAWLERELAATRKPVMIGSHIPIVSPAVFLDPGRIAGTPDAPALAVRRAHVDVKRIGQLFAKHPHVKLCVSGHLHEIDRADFMGVTYLNNPAVCGDWWKGLHRGIWGEMYTMLDLHPDGSFDYERIDYGWQPAAAPATQPGAAATRSMDS
ncbi:MAG: 3,5-cyclic-AMP phosphodiesterase [Phycisphaerales bacterium]|jgi:3',5'-cyclic AMP phosphodiesterase CpdA|nr:3,5-cyclic-AMP phosphodiesterase [Phycisphaerales bacterium]